MLSICSCRLLRTQKANSRAHVGSLLTNLVSRRLYSSSDDTTSNLGPLSQPTSIKNTRGKKLQPEKATFVVLNPKEAGIFKKKRIPGFFKPHNRLKERLSVLEGVEIGENGAQLEKPSSEILQEIESQRRKLLVFKSSVSKEQAVKSIRDLRPSDESKIMSSKRYQQLKGLLEMAYTIPQLKEYVKQYHGVAISKSIPKKKLIPKILDTLWNCKVDESISESEDLVVERIIDVEKRDIYLLLLTNNGKILQNFARIGATLAVALNENKIIVRATSSLVKYVEVSLSKILDNVQKEILPVHDIIKNHTPSNSQPVMPPEDLVALVQKESAVFFEKLLDDDSDSYLITAFGAKRLTKAKNLLLWALNYSPQCTTDVTLLLDEDVSAYKNYPFTDIDCLDWTEKGKEWFRLQKPMAKAQSLSSDRECKMLKVTDEMIDDLYEKLTSPSDNTMANFHGNNDSKVLSITLGQILTTLNGKHTTFQPKITHITSQLMKLPLYDGELSGDELYTVDHHEYFVQLKFIPDLSTTQSAKNIPPLELWFELDDYDKAISSTLRCILHLEDRSIFLRTPHLSCDYKLNVDRVIEVIKPYEEDSQNWLFDQPSLKEFLLEAQLTFQGRKKLFIPKKLQINLQLSEEAVAQPITFDYVKVNYRRVLKLKYMNKYLVQFTDVKGGSGSGRYTRVDFISPELMTRGEFATFLRDVAQFI